MATAVLRERVSTLLENGERGRCGDREESAEGTTQ